MGRIRAFGNIQQYMHGKYYGSNYTNNMAASCSYGSVELSGTVVVVLQNHINLMQLRFRSGKVMQLRLLSLHLYTAVQKLIYFHAAPCGLGAATLCRKKIKIEQPMLISGPLFKWLLVRRQPKSSVSSSVADPDPQYVLYNLQIRMKYSFAIVNLTSRK
jgi:hypothetical protein